MGRRKDEPAWLPTKPLPARPMAHHTPHAYATVATGVTPPRTLLLDARQEQPTTAKVSAWVPHAQPAPKDISTHWQRKRFAHFNARPEHMDSTKAQRMIQRAEPAPGVIIVLEMQL